MTLVVQKFGGTSVADPERIRQVADHVARTRRHGNDVVVVVSAMGKETDELIRLAGAVARVRPGREMDMLSTAGERKATALLCMALHDIGVPAESFTGSQAGFVTDTNHTNARILEIRPDRVRQSLDQGNVPVVGGAQGVSTDRDVTFLGRNGSDVTAMAQAIVSAVVHDTSEAKVTLGGVPDKPGIAARVFRALADAGVNVDMIVQNVSDHGVTDISFTVPRDDLESATRITGELAGEIGATGVTT